MDQNTDQNNFDDLLHCVNSEENAEFIWDFPGTSPDDRAARLAAKAAFDPADAERALTLLCGELCGLVLDRDLYRREFPAAQDEACALRIVGESGDDAPDFRTFTARFIARSPERDRTVRIAAALRCSLPPVWVSVGSKRLGAPVTFAAVTADGDTSTGDEIGNGKRLFHAELPLRIRVCTTPPREN